eukprot:TRINITY_DN5734_c3_g1_i1.p1 TRINITY_DN5734_c3_g1~~TRINITY_DN5734_c3_g1_i1.p1  ORF type:complete len:107 (-),score=0.61 TRINITY_DN5734_c3_g1_i1:116-412(-)
MIFSITDRKHDFAFSEIIKLQFNNQKISTQIQKIQNKIRTTITQEQNKKKENLKKVFVRAFKNEVFLLSLLENFHILKVFSFGKQLLMSILIELRQVV